MSWWGKHNKIFGSIGLGLGIAAATVLTAGAVGAGLGALGVTGASFGAAAGSAGTIGAAVAGGLSAGTSNYQGERQAEQQEKLANEQAQREKEFAAQSSALNKGQQQTIDTIADERNKKRSAIKRTQYASAAGAYYTGKPKVFGA